MNTIDALRKMVDHFPGGRPAMAQRLGNTDEVLRKKLSGAPTHKLGAIEANEISELCIEAQSLHCYAYVNVVNNTAGGFVKLEPRETDEDAPSLMASTVGLVTGASTVLADITAARADGLISDNERKVIEDHAHEVIRNMNALLREVARENEAGKPAPHLRSAA